MLYIDGVEKDRETPTCSDSVCTVEGALEWEAGNGTHQQRIVITDRAQNQNVIDGWVRVDGTAPTVAAGGNLRDAGQSSLTASEYQMQANAADETGGGEQSGIEDITVTVDDKVAEIFEQDCEPGDGCGLSKEFVYRNAAFEAGARVVRVEATDRAGNTATDAFTVQDATPASECDAGSPLTSGGQACPLTRSTCLAGPAVLPNPAAAVDAENVARGGLPAILDPSVAFMAAGMLVEPGLRVENGALSSMRTISDAAISTNPQGGMVLGSGDDAICVTPSGVRPLCQSSLRRFQH